MSIVSPRVVKHIKGVVKVSELRKEIHGYIDVLSDSRLEALRPILTLLVDNTLTIETDLTDEEREIIARGNEEYKTGVYVPLESLL